MYPSQFSEGNENERVNASSIRLNDDYGRSLECFVERSLSVEDREYVLLMPVDSPVEIFVWQGEEEDAEAILVEDDDTIEQIFDTAQAVLSEQNLALKNTAYALTVEGELPPVEETELFTLELDDEDVADLEPEKLQLLATFFHEGLEYAVYTPLDPLLFFARVNNGKHELLSPEEFRQVQPMLEEQLFDEVE